MRNQKAVTSAVLVGIGALLLGICFILPWANVFGIVNQAGFDIAQNEYYLWLLPIAALLGLGWAVYVGYRGYSTNMSAFAGSGLAILALLGVAIFLVRIATMIPGGEGLKMLTYGFWGAVIATVMMLLGAVLAFTAVQPEYGGGYAPPVYAPTPYAQPMRPAEPPTPIGVAAPAQAAYPPTMPQVAEAPGTFPPVPPAAPAPLKTEILQKAPPQMAWLVIKTGLRAGKEFRLLEETRIGREAAQNDVVIDDSAISKQHAKIRLESGQWILYDLASTNGTFVNDQQIYRQPLTDGDVVRIGQTTFAFIELKEKEEEKKEA